MAETTGIQWCDSTLNPWIGCTKIGPGCDFCYAEALMDARHHRVQWGAGNPRSKTAVSTWRMPRAWNHALFVQCLSCGWRGGTNIRKKEGKLHCPDCKGNEFKAARRRVFCASLADVFDNEVDAAWRADLFDLIRLTPNLDWLLLTKRIGNASKMIAEAIVGGTDPVEAGARWPWPNVWLGATVVNQDEADRDINKLLAVPAAMHFLSYEPALGPINVEPWLKPIGVVSPDPHGRDRALGWVIAGGESGPNARPLDVEWIWSIVRQCKAAGVPVHVKQLGRTLNFGGCSGPGEHWPAGTFKTDTGRGNFRIELKHGKGADLAEWPEDLRIREFPRA